MKELIMSYRRSCEMAEARLSELAQQRKILEKTGENSKIKELDLDRRISLLYRERSQMKEIIAHLTAYVNYVGSRQ